MTGSLRSEKHVLIVLACGAGLGMLITSGLSCVGDIRDPGSSIDHWLPGTESEFKSYITPECQPVKESLQEILGDPPYTLSQLGFNDIRDWVADNIAYESDEKKWGRDYWQTPEETLSYQTGDCEDFSILLCSLLRAYGIDAQRVYVALGVNGEEDGHAFVIEDWYCNGEWRRVESQVPSQFSSYHRLLFLEPRLDSRLDKYEITVVFNDFYCYDEPSSWNDVQEDSDSPAEIVTAIGDILRRLSRLLEYLLRLLLD